VIGVAVYHLFPGALPGGFIGVDVFFVISGFLITGLLVEERSGTGRIALGSFWERRARRLLPALATLLLVCSTLAYLVGGDVLVGLPRQLIGAATFSYNWTAIAAGADYFGSTPELFRNLWSLAVEEQFYLLWPLALLLICLIPARWVRAVVLVVLAAGSAVAMAVLAVGGQDATRVYFGSDTHVFGLAIGAALAIALSGSTAPLASRVGRTALAGVGVIGAGIVVAAAFLLRDDDVLTYRGGLLLVSLATAAVIWAAVRTGWLGRALDVTPLSWVGIRSYGLYLWHWPIFVLLGAAGRRYGIEVEPWVIGAAAALLTVLAATLSFALIEQPIRRNGFVSTGRRIRAGLANSVPLRVAAVAVTSITVVAVAGTVLAIQAAPASSSAQRYVAAGQAAVDVSDLETAAAPARPAPPLASAVNALPGAPTGPPQIQYPTGDQISGIGDSVMLASAAALQSKFPGIAIDASVSRSMFSGPELVQGQVDVGTLRPIVVIGLGTNGSITRAVLDQLLVAVGPSRQLVVLTVQAPRSWIPPNNAIIRAFAADNSRNVTISDWEAAIAPRIRVLATDRVHPGPTGAGIYADALAQAMNQVVERQQRVADAKYAAEVELGKQRTRIIQLMALSPCPLPGAAGGILCSA